MQKQQNMLTSVKYSNDKINTFFLTSNLDKKFIKLRSEILIEKVWVKWDPNTNFLSFLKLMVDTWLAVYWVQLLNSLVSCIIIGMCLYDTHDW